MPVLTKSIVDAAYSKTYRTVSELPSYVREGAHPFRRDFELPDYAGVLEKGWRWMFEQMAAEQPLTFREFASLAPELEYREAFIDSPPEKLYWGDLLLKVKDRYLAVFPYMRGETYEELSALGESDLFISSLPPAIATGYYNRVAGLGWVNEVPYGSRQYSRTWPHRADFTSKISGLLEKEHRRNGPDVAEAMGKFSGASSNSSTDPLSSFYILLDTRPVGDYSDSGELWLVEEEASAKQVVLVKSMDFSKAVIHPSPVESLDRHTSALLRRLQMG